MVHGFESHAPALVHEGGGFKASYFSHLACLEEANFWFRARNKIIIWALKKYASGFNSLLEIGCGTGFVLSSIARHFPGARLRGSEIFTDGLAFAVKRLPSIDLMQMDARHIPFFDEFDVVGAFDVLEHIKEDSIVLDEIYNALKPHGVLILTVPQHAWLWSEVDEYAFHERRYSTSEIGVKLKASGFDVIRSTSFVTTLLPAMIISRLIQKRHTKKFDPTSELQINPVVNFLFEKMLSLELAGISLGMSYPVGGSRLVVARKA